MLIRAMSRSEPSTDAGELPLTDLLRRASSGDREAAEAAMPLVYRELRRIAEARMAGERRDHTLQATALVHEMWLKLMGVREAQWSDRAAFYHDAATAMRRILVDYARARLRAKRGGGERPERLSPESVAAPPDLCDAATFLELDERIAQLAREDPRAARIVQLRFFAGLSADETAETLGLSRRTVLREWSYARARLHAALCGEDEKQWTG